MNTIVNGLRNKRREMNLLLIEVSNQCGLLPSTILKIEMGTHSNINDIQKLTSFYSN
ncbi:hypothetical protein ACFRCQ_22820 [Cytobacillus firmus]|uniref:hypothetical protein n=1 Tax=Cytobacillus firmus TaxID=1399 RepID=UPI0036CF4A76